LHHRNAIDRVVRVVYAIHEHSTEDFMNRKVMILVFTFIPIVVIVDLPLLDNGFITTDTVHAQGSCPPDVIAGCDITASLPSNEIWYVEYTAAGTGVRGRASSPTGTTNGVIGEAISPTGRGVTGVASATSGSNIAGIGVQGITTGDGFGSIGVYGLSLYSPGQNTAMRANAYGTTGRALLAEAVNTVRDSSIIYGVEARVAGQFDTAIYALASSTTGFANGIEATIVGPSGYAVDAYAGNRDSDAASIAVKGQSDAPSGRGVYGLALGSDTN
jgi:hypothetical protein